MIAGQAKVKACKKVLFTEGIPDIEIKNTWLMQLTHFIYLNLDLDKMFGILTSRPFG